MTKEALLQAKSGVPQVIADPRLLNNLSLLLAASPDSELRDPQAAVDFMQRTVEQHPNHVNANLFWATLGVAHVANGDWQEGTQALQRAIDMDTKSTIVWFSLAIACHEMGDNQRAMSNYKEGEKHFAATPNPSSRILHVKSEATRRLGVRTAEEAAVEQ